MFSIPSNLTQRELETKRYQFLIINRISLMCLLKFFTGPNPITAGHFSANFYCSINKAERIDGANASRLNRIDDLITSNTMIE